METHHSPTALFRLARAVVLVTIGLALGTPAGTATAEPVRGFYFRVEAGPFTWSGDFDELISIDKALSFQVGGHAVQTDHFTLGVGAHLLFGVNNALSYSDAIDVGLGSSSSEAPVQGDFASVILGGGIRYYVHFDPERRVSLCGKLGVGLFVSPSLREESDFDVGAMQTGPGFAPFVGFGVHFVPPLEHLGLGMEYTALPVVGTGAGAMVAHLIAFAVEVTL